MPTLLFQIALIIIIVREAYVTVQLLQVRRNWLDILFHASVAIVGLYWLL